MGILDTLKNLFGGGEAPAETPVEEVQTEEIPAEDSSTEEAPAEETETQEEQPVQ